MNWGWFLVPWLVLWAVEVLGSWIVSAPKHRRVLGAAISVCAISTLALQHHSLPAQRLLASSLFLLLAIKAVILLSKPRAVARGSGLLGALLYFTVWPGMEPERLKAGVVESQGAGPIFTKGFVCFICGAIATIGVALAVPYLGSTGVGWLGIAALLMTVHFGFAQVMTAVLRVSGRNVEKLFDEPFASTRVSEFWSKRWNRPFISMNQQLLMRSMSRAFGVRGAVFAAFLVSGFLHELAISYPAGGGWGLPFLYFLIQGLLVFLERRIGIRSRVWTFLCVALPFPLLFHDAFRERLVVPLFVFLHSVICAHPLSWYFDRELWIIGALQLCVLLASAQVPKKLRWNEELARLSPFNRKLMWVYGSFIVLTILGFGALTFVLHSSMLVGDRAAVALAAFMSIFWFLRIVIDVFVFKSEDWPPGDQYVIGHALLNCLFLSLVVGYGGLVVWHLVT